MDYDVQVPRETELTVSAVNGEVAIRELSGDVSVDAVNGEIAISEVSGDISAEAVNGQIAISQVSGDISAETVNGSIELEGVSGNVDGRAVNGRIEVTLVGDRLAGDGVDLTTVNGPVAAPDPAKLFRSTRIGDGHWRDGRRFSDHDLGEAPAAESRRRSAAAVHWSA